MIKQSHSSFIFRILVFSVSLALASCNAPIPSGVKVDGITTPAVQTPITANVEGMATPSFETPITGNVEGIATPPGGYEESTQAVPPVGLTFTPIVLAGTPMGTITPTHGPDCDRVQFFDDVTYKDQSVVNAKEAITKTWRVKNVGTCAWDSTYRLVFVRGEQMQGVSPSEIFTDPVAPGSMTDVSIKLTIPEENGAHFGIWKMVNGAGDSIKKADGSIQELSILINVENGKGGRVSSVRTWSYFYTGIKCTNSVEYDINANIYVDGPVSVNYTWGTTNGLLNVGSQTHVFTSAGNMEVTAHISPPFADPNNIRVSLTANGVSSSFTICP